MRTKKKMFKKEVDIEKLWQAEKAKESLMKIKGVSAYARDGLLLTTWPIY